MQRTAIDDENHNMAADPNSSEEKTVRDDMELTHHCHVNWYVFRPS